MDGLDPRELGGVAELVGYATAVLLTWLLALALRALVRNKSGGVGEPPAEDIAYLTAGPRQAVYAALSALRSTGSVQAEAARHGGKVHTVGPLPPGSGEVTTAVHHAAHGGIVTVMLPAHPAVSAVLQRTGVRLRAQGWLLSPGRRWALGLSTVPVFLLAGFGGLRFVLNLPGDEPRQGILSMLTLVCAVLALILGSIVAARPQIRTRRANRLVTDLRRRHAGLAPRHNPSLQTNGPAAAALAVGLFGTAALWTADRAFADAAQVEEQPVRGGDRYGGDGGYRDYNQNSSCGS